LGTLIDLANTNFTPMRPISINSFTATGPVNIKFTPVPPRKVSPANDEDAAESEDGPVSYPAWVPYTAAGSLGVAALGLAAAFVSPGPITGALFPLGMGGIWLASRAIRERA